ncbi:MAG TPA: type II secretion system F family protein, partial [Phycisphaeraceae bacterium]|nr:type II secretion system F family protein [Phycisphaeraceae bacterium]
ERGETATVVVCVDEPIRKQAGNGRPAQSQPAAQATVSQQNTTSRGKAMSGPELASFIRELSTAVDAGLPLIKALRSLENQARSKRQQAMLQHLIARVEAGRTLADAAREWGRPFNNMTVNVIRAGELSGKFAEVTNQLADLLEREIELRRSILSATLYPMIVLCVVIIAIVIVVTMIVPPILTAVGGELDTLPLPTRVVQAFADFVSSYWPYIIIGFLAFLLLLKRMLADEAIRLRVDRFLLHVPVLGGLLREVAVARFTRLLGTMIGAGLPILESLRITRRTLNNRELARVIEEVEGEIARGRGVAAPLEKSGYFPSLLIQIVDLGERSGKLESMLLRAADSFDRRTQSAIKVFTAVLPPVLILFLAGIVGFVLAAILLPLVELQSALG